jgi:hypothetical protein
LIILKTNGRRQRGQRAAAGHHPVRMSHTPGVPHMFVLVSGNGAAGRALVTADLVDDAVDQAVETIKRRGLPLEDVALVRLESIGPALAQPPLASVVWADLLSQAGANARPLARYLVFMATAGVIATFGVIYANITLVVGAMAISPDLLPICAAATALVLRRWTLAARAFATLLIGLGCACLVGGALTFVPHQLQLGPTRLLPPASAYLGVAAGVGDESKALGALAGLGVNIAMLLLGGIYDAHRPARAGAPGRGNRQYLDGLDFPATARTRSHGEDSYHVRGRGHVRILLAMSNRFTACTVGSTASRWYTLRLHQTERRLHVPG